MSEERNEERRARGLGRGAALLAAILAFGLPARGQSLQRRTLRLPDEANPAERALPLRSAEGERVGTWTADPAGVRLRPRGRPELVAPALQHWIASPDGRTLAGAGDPAALEHPFELQVVVFRDGTRVAALAEGFAPESAVTVGRDGRVAIVGHVAGARGQPFALALDAGGGLLWRHALPEGTLGRDPMLFGGRLLVRMHGVFDEGRGGSVVSVDVSGVSTLLEVPALGLVGFPDAGSALVRTRDELTLVDGGSGRVLWRRAFEERPAGPHAWELWRADGRQSLAVVTAGLRRRGAPAAAPALLLLDAADGTLLERVEIAASGPPSDVDVLARGDELVVDWRGTQETFAWTR